MAQVTSLAQQFRQLKQDDGRISRADMTQLVNAARQDGQVTRAEEPVLLAAFDDHLETGDVERMEERPAGAHQVADISDVSSQHLTRIYEANGELFMSRNYIFFSPIELYRLGSAE
jgi:hypothetical protein